MKMRLAILPLLLLPSLAMAQDPDATKSAKQQPQANTPPNPDAPSNKAGDIVTQPVRDVGLSKKEIPPALERATRYPYAPPSGKCAGISSEMASLNEALGPDYGAHVTAKNDKAGKVAATGGRAVVNSLIPFRDVVREISGASAADRRMQAAVDAGLARRGYLHGLAVSRGCRRG